MQKNGGKLNLKNISFSCGQNARMITIVGPVGAGKVRHYVQYIHALHVYMHSGVVLRCIFIHLGSWLDH